MMIAQRNMKHPDPHRVKQYYINDGEYSWMSDTADETGRSRQLPFPMDSEQFEEWLRGNPYWDPCCVDPDLWMDEGL